MSVVENKYSLSRSIRHCLQQRADMSFATWLCFSVAEEDGTIAICKASSAMIARGGKKLLPLHIVGIQLHCNDLSDIGDSLLVIVSAMRCFELSFICVG